MKKIECPIVIAFEAKTREQLIKEIMDWQVDLQITVSRIEELKRMPLEHLLEMLESYEATEAN